MLATPSTSLPHPSPSPPSLCSSFCSVPASRPLSSIYTAGCCLFVSIVVLFVCIVSGVDNRPLGSIKDRMAAFQGNGKLCVCVCLCMLPVSACNRMNICMTVCCPPPPPPARSGGGGRGRGPRPPEATTMTLSPPPPPPPGSGVGVSSAAGAKSSEVRRNPPT